MTRVNPGQSTSSPSADEVVADEARLLGRPCNLVAAWNALDDVLVVIYDCEPQGDLIDGKQMATRRLAVWLHGKPCTSIITRTEWIEAES